MDLDDFLYTLDEMLEDERYSFATTTLAGIKATVTRMQVITEGQRTAVANIRRSKGEDEEKAGKQWTRRYEGMR